MRIRDSVYQSSYGTLFGTYMEDHAGLYFRVSAFEPIRGVRRAVNHRLPAEEVNDERLRDAFERVVQAEAVRPR